MLNPALRRPLRRTRVPQGTRRILTATFATVLFASGALHAEKGTTFFSGDFSGALAAAKKAKQNVLVEVFADWCAPCKKQAKEVFETSTGAVLTRDVVAVRLDFDAAKNQTLVKRLNVLSLPTVLIVRPDGSEIGRVEGYETAKAFVSAMEPLLAGNDALAALERHRAAAPPGSKRAAELRVSVGHALLVRGETDRGLALLEAASIETKHAAPAQDALFLVGRYYSRVREDHAQARHVWRELYVRFPRGDYRLTALWWYVGDLVALKRTAQAGDFLSTAVATSPKDKDIADIAVASVEKHRAFHDKVKAAIAASKVSAKLKRELLARIDAAPKTAPSMTR